MFNIGMFLMTINYIVQRIVIPHLQLMSMLVVMGHFKCLISWFPGLSMASDGGLSY